MATLFNNGTIIHYADAIHQLQAAETMRDHDHRLPGGQLLEQRQNMLLGSGIQPFSRFIQQPETAVM